MRFCDTLKYLRETRNLSQMEMSRQMGISQATISSLEKGIRKPSVGMLKKLSSFFHVPVSTFVQDTPPSANESEQAILEALHNNPKLCILFDKTKFMDEKDIDAVLHVVSAIVRERGE